LHQRSVKIEKVNILVARTAQEIDEAYRHLSTAQALGCDTETSSLSARSGRLFSVQFSDGELNVLVPVSEGVNLGRLEEILSSPRITKIFHNAKFDIEFLREKGFQVENVFCTMIAEKILTRGADQSCSLAETLYRYFAVDLEKSHRAKFTRRWDGVWTPELVNYALSDVIHLPRLYAEQKLWLERLGLTEDFNRQMQKIK
jgi:ribonuclease D